MSHIDTEDLSKEAYGAILVEAEKFHRHLCTHFGLLSFDSANEEEFIANSLELIDELKAMTAIDLVNVFYYNVDKKKLNKTLDKIKSGIEELKTIPHEQRTFDYK